ncbi:MAG: hypothetical protein LDL31_08795 [Prosthecobacter sp.]|nr:hypothetical protein [Prosthecobacter sp.]
MSRTRKQPYRKSRVFDASCRCHGSCNYCAANRLHRHRRQLAKAMGEHLHRLPGRPPFGLRRVRMADDSP